MDARHVVEAQQPREVGLDARRTSCAAERLDGFYHGDVSVARNIDAIEDLSERVFLRFGERHLGRIVFVRDERPRAAEDVKSAAPKRRGGDGSIIITVHLLLFLRPRLGCLVAPDGTRRPRLLKR